MSGVLWWAIANILISCVCWFVLSYANAMLFTYLGEADINGHMESCYTYDTMTLPARIVAFLCGCGAIGVFVVIWGCWLSVLF